MSDVTQFFHHGNKYSTEAYQTIKQDKSLLRSKVVNYIKEQGIFGATCDEVEQGLEMSHQTASARVTEAKIKGEITEFGKRKTRSGRNATVYVVLQEA